MTAEAPPREPRWHWRNCRWVSLELAFVPLDWGLEIINHGSDVYGGGAGLKAGPFVLRCCWSIGNNSAERGIQRWIGLSETEAWERACRWEGIAIEEDANG